MCNVVSGQMVVMAVTVGYVSLCIHVNKNKEIPVQTRYRP
jgi:hypothetical protein